MKQNLKIAVFFLLIALVVAILTSCGSPITAIQQPESEPTIIGYWVHDTQNLQVEWLDDGSYESHYLSFDGYGKWRLVPEYTDDYVVKFYEDSLCKSPPGYYAVLFSGTRSMSLFGFDDPCAGRLQRWAGKWTRRW